MRPNNLILAALLATTPAAAMAGNALSAFDVAEDISRFVDAEAPVFDDGMPAYGNAFITQGYVYPAGTLDGGVEGTLPDGSPAFPDKVIGTWTCDGYLVGDGMHTATGAIVISRQIIAFEDGDLLITHGPELADVDVSVTRAVTGGTGDYADAPAEIRQTLLGMSEGYGVRLQMEFARETARDEEARPVDDREAHLAFHERRNRRSSEASQDVAAPHAHDRAFSWHDANLDAIDYGHRTPNS